MPNNRFCNAQTLRIHMRRAHSGHPKALTKQKELAVHTALAQAGVSFDYQLHMPFHACDLPSGPQSESKCAYVDFAIAKEWGYVLLEVDEQQHDTHPTSCDVRRDFDIAASAALGSRHKLVVMRCNPDTFRVAGKSRAVSQKERQAKLLETIEAMSEPRGFRRLFMYYDRDAEDSTLPTVAKEWDAAAREVSAVV